MFGEEEKFFTCPYCNSQISFLLESLYGNQTYIEDCEVCCKPIQVTYSSENGEITSFDTKALDE